MAGMTRREAVRAGVGAAVGLYLPAGLLTPKGPHRAAARRAGGPHLKALEELSKRLHGRLLLPGDPRYAAASQPANAQFAYIHPIAAAICKDVEDVATCVRWSREYDIDAVARTGGHSYAGFSATTGLVIDLRALRSVEVNLATGVATIGGGAVNEDVFNATKGGELLLPAGTCLGVGVGGLTLGGGIGYNTHWAGLTCDHLRSTRMVTATGDLIEVDQSQNPDLFWACRGGSGGSFGINTSFTFELARIPVKEVSFYRFDYRGAEDAAAVLAELDRILERAPGELNAVAMAQAVEVGSGGPREAIATFSRGQYLGPPEKLRELVHPLLQVARPTMTTYQTMPFWDMQELLAGAEIKRHAFGDISRYSKAPLPRHVVGKVVDLLTTCPHRDPGNNGSFWSLGWVGGKAVRKFGRTGTAYVHRDMLTLLRATPVWEASADVAVGRELTAWAAEVMDAIAAHTPAESYQNFPNRGIENWARQYYAENLPRLVDVKASYDPSDLFHNPQSIPPRLGDL